MNPPQPKKTVVLGDDSDEESKKANPFKKQAFETMDKSSAPKFKKPAPKPKPAVSKQRPVVKEAPKPKV